MDSYILIITLFTGYCAICVAAFYFMTYHNGGVRPGNWEDE